MQGFRDLVSSERGIFCIAALLAATLLVTIGKLTGEVWIDFMKYLVGFLVASKTVTTAVETYTTKNPQIPTAKVVGNEKAP